MAALTTIAAVLGTAIAAKSYSDSRKQASAAKSAAKENLMADNMAAGQMAESAVALQKRDAAATAAEQTAADQAKALETTPEVTIDSAENNNVRRRRVQAQFNVASGGATASAGSVRL